MERARNEPRPSERDLVRGARDGDPEAFGSLVDRHMRRAYFSALGLVGSHEDALDLSQEAFARAFRARAELDPERPFYPWLYRILRRLCFNFLRDRRRRAEKLRAAAGWLVEETSGSVSQRPDRAAERSQLRERLEAAIDGLSARDREVLVLREFEERTYREIAALLDIPIGTVMSRLYAARRRLASRLEAAP